MTPKKDWKEAFLAELSQSGNVRASCLAAGVSRKTVYQARTRSTTFAQAWADALDEAADIMEREAWRRAVKGTEKPVFGSLGYRLGSGEIGRIQEYSDTLLIFLLKAARPEKFRDTVNQEYSGTVKIKVEYGTDRSPEKAP